MQPDFCVVTLHALHIDCHSFEYVRNYDAVQHHAHPRTAPEPRQERYIKACRACVQEGAAREQKWRDAAPCLNEANGAMEGPWAPGSSASGRPRRGGQGHSRSRAPGQCVCLDMLSLPARVCECVCLHLILLVRRLENMCHVLTEELYVPIVYVVPNVRPEGMS